MIFAAGSDCYRVERTNSRASVAPAKSSAFTAHNLRIAVTCTLHSLYGSVIAQYRNRPCQETERPARPYSRPPQRAEIRSVQLLFRIRFLDTN